MESEIPTIRKNFICEIHKEPISFICAANQWHFRILCSLCIPQHTQKHQKNVKILLQNMSTVQKKSQQQKQKAIKIYNSHLKQIKQLLNLNQNQYIQYQQLEKLEKAIKQQINKLFIKEKQKIKKQRQQIDNYQKDLLEKLKSNIQIRLNQLNNLSKYQGQKWVDTIKCIYFKDDLQIYNQQIQEIITDYKENIINKIDNQLNQQQIILNIVKIINQSLIINQKQKNDKKIIKQEPNKIKVSKKKKCPNCQQQMEYLTQLKKHLVCRNCGGKQRNYVPKNK